MQDVYLNWIDGGWAEGGAGRMTVENPGTGEALAEQALADAADVDRAVMAARRVHDSGVLTALRPVERGRMVRAMGDWLLAHHEELARLLTLEQGKALWEARNEIRNAARYFEYYGNQAETLEGKQIPLGAGYMDFTVLEPYGVSAQIIPWNFPMEIAARSIAAGIATGNACVVKTSEMTPLTSHAFGLAAEAAGLPPGAVNVLTGWGHEAGAALASHPGVNQIVFTGSVATGSAIAQAAARNIVPCVLELGGKSAAIVHRDADLDAFLGDVRRGIFMNAGQICSAMSRIVVHRAVHDDLVDRIAGLAKSIDVGPGIDRGEPLKGMGAMARARLDRAGRGRGRDTGDRRAAAQHPRPLHGAHGAVPRRSGQRDRPDRGLRPRGLGHGLRGRGRGHRHRERHRLRPCRGRLHPRPRSRDARGG